MYFLRLATVALSLLTLVIVLNALLLLPSYLYARGEAERGRNELAALTASSQSSEEAEITARTEALRGTAVHLARLETAPAATAALRAVLQVPRPGLTLRGFTYTAPPAPEQHARLGISGVAASRDALRQYVAALDALPFVEKAELPISAYAKESDIAFTVTLSGPLRP